MFQLLDFLLQDDIRRVEEDSMRLVAEAKRLWAE